MPQYVSKRGGQFLFRQGVPKNLQAVIGKTEIKKALGADRSAALSLAKSYAAETDKLFNDARASLNRKSQALANRSLQKRLIEEVTPELRAALRSLWLSIVDTADVQRRASCFESMGQDEVVEQSAEVTSIFRQALVSGDFSMVLGPMHQLLHLAGYELAPSLYGTPAELELAIEYARAVQLGTKLLAARDEGDDLPLPVVPPLPNLVEVAGSREAEVQVLASSMGSSSVVSPVATPATGVLKLSDIIQTVLDDWKRGKPMKVKLSMVLKLFLTVVGDKPITQLRQLDIKRFFNLVNNLPPRWSDECRKLNVGVVELAEMEHPAQLSSKTFDDTYVAAFRLFLDEATLTWQDEGFPATLTTRGIRYTGKVKAGQNKQRAFTRNELKTVFEGKSLLESSQKMDELHKFWLPVVCLYTGARINEICQLNPQCDIRRVSDILILHITEESESAPGIIKTVKNDSSRRLIPVHEKLIELGFDQYVAALQAAGAQQLFPAWRPYNGNAGANAGKWHTRWLKRHDVNVESRDDGRKVRGAHAYRHTLLTYGRKAELVLWGISGHATNHQDGADGKRKDDNLESPVGENYVDEEIVWPLEYKQATLNQLDYRITIPTPIKLSSTAARRIVEKARASSKRTRFSLTL
ncbi:DUF6538 domain-containing protein [Zoogloea sp.]|uniref:DUF6538 domain-containing protein n=1 Tax=Zoogloea sp. TaxID=49181 RepID=UPI0035AFEA33